jgi:hypothetical protein
MGQGQEKGCLGFFPRNFIILSILKTQAFICCIRKWKPEPSVREHIKITNLNKNLQNNTGSLRNHNFEWEIDRKKAKSLTPPPSGLYTGVYSHCHHILRAHDRDGSAVARFGTVLSKGYCFSDIYFPLNIWRVNQLERSCSLLSEQINTTYSQRFTSDSLTTVLRILALPLSSNCRSLNQISLKGPGFVTLRDNLAYYSCMLQMTAAKLYLSLMMTMIQCCNSCCSHVILLKLSRYVFKGRDPHRAHELGESLNTLRIANCLFICSSRGFKRIFSSLCSILFSPLLPREERSESQDAVVDWKCSGNRFFLIPPPLTTVNVMICKWAGRGLW